MRGLRVRPCLPRDIPAVTTLYRHAVLHGTGTFELEPPDESEMAARHERITGQGYPYLVAADGSEVLGYAYVAACRDRPAYRFTVEDSVYVRQDCHRSGVGTALLRHLILAAEARRYRQIVAVIGDSRNAGSVRLHQSAGFTNVGTLKAVGWKQERWLDVVLMQKMLGPGDTSSPDAP